MSDLIDRQAAIDICTNAIDLWHGQLGEGALVAVQGGIKALPSAGIQDQIDNAYMHGYTAAEARYRDALRHGHWVASDEDGFVCSICRCGYKDQPTMMGKPMFDYCPVCGARMDGDTDE